MLNTMSKIRGQEKGPGYPQAEALLADAMLKFGKELGDECNFGNLVCFLLNLSSTVDDHKYIQFHLACLTSHT